MLLYHIARSKTAKFGPTRLVAKKSGCQSTALGGLRGLVQLRQILGNIQVLVLPEQLAISKANEAFTAEGKFINAVQQEKILAMTRQFAGVLNKLYR